MTDPRPPIDGARLERRRLSSKVTLNISRILGGMLSLMWLAMCFIVAACVFTARAEPIALLIIIPFGGMSALFFAAFVWNSYLEYDSLGFYKAGQLYRWENVEKIRCLIGRWPGPFSYILIKYKIGSRVKWIKGITSWDNRAFNEMQEFCRTNGGNAVGKQ